MVLPVVRVGAITIYAAGKAYELIETTQGVTAKHYIGDFAVLTQTVATGAFSTNYLHRDHLGSVDAITNENGDVIQRMSFDAWGKRRETNWQPMGLAAIEGFNTDITNRGFTGHEQIDSVGLIHMNGRVYDAELGRFLSADPNVQALDNLQNFNRYSYVLNNPLSYTDPTGFFFAKLFRAIGKAFGKIFSAIGGLLKKALRSSIVRAIIQVVACAGPQAGLTCALAAGAMAKAAGGSMRDVFKAIAFSYISRAVWTGVGSALRAAGMATNFLVKGFVHGVVGGALAVARGGNFIQGFAANAIGAIAGLAANQMVLADGIITQSEMVMHTVIAAAAGCAGAVVSGGKCVNGAVTAAFANLHNGLISLVALSAARCAFNAACRVAVVAGATWVQRMGGRYAGVFMRQFQRSSVWLQGNFTRGNTIEAALGHNLARNYPVIDRFKDGVATSIKSLHLGARSYQNVKRLDNLLHGYINRLANFQGKLWAGVNTTNISSRQLMLVIPRGAGSPAQMQVIQNVVTHGASVGVKVKVVPY